METESENVSTVVNANLCTGCGTCQALCLKHAIHMETDNSKGIFIPKIDASKCTLCGVCLKVCPGLAIDFSALNLSFFGSFPGQSILGNVLDFYVGHSSINNSKTNQLVSSGGIGTELLLFALKEGVIDGALVTKMNKDNPLIPEAILTSSVEEILESAGSKYCPCSSNIALEKVLLSKTGKFAVVGLPCQIQAIRKAQLLFPALQEKIVLLIGLFCAHATSFKGTESMLKKLGLRADEITSIAYRGSGWPSYLHVSTKRRDYTVPYSRSFRSYFPMFDSYFFVPWRCLFCRDHFNQLADVSAGDIWLPGGSKTKMMQSAIVVRSKKANDLLQAATKAKSIEVATARATQIIKSQGDIVKFKNSDYGLRVRLATSMGKKTPRQTFILSEHSSTGSYIVNILRLHSSSLKKGTLTQCILSGVPLWVYRTYNVALSILAKLP
jgi:coenzyme F420 hydrogenase subunit beta